MNDFYDFLLEASSLTINHADRFTPEAIKSVIEQLRKREDVKIMKIEDGPNEVRVIGQTRMGNSWDLEKPFEGVILCMQKVDEAIEKGPPPPSARELFDRMPVTLSQEAKDEIARCMHFEGFAELVLGDLMQTEAFDIVDTERFWGGTLKAEVRRVIARWASRLVLHTILNVKHIDLDRESPKDHVLMIPDMTAWPEEEVEQ